MSECRPIIKRESGVEPGMSRGKEKEKEKEKEDGSSSVYLVS